MTDVEWLDRQSASSCARLLPRLERRFSVRAGDAEWQSYAQRLAANFSRLFAPLHQLYGSHYDFFFHLEEIVATATEMWLKRPDALKALDAQRMADPRWFQSNRMVGAMLYVDLFAGDLTGLRERVPYLTELGINYLHLMPLFRTPTGDDDGGYAVSSYREVDPDLGTMEQLADLATDLRHHGISLCLDFVCNHTSDDHEWAMRALAGEVEYQDYYRMYPDRTLPDEFEKTILAIFPEDHPGCFTYRHRIRRWVWTTFHNYQWDLNYENPVVFNHMAEELLFLANQGVEVLRLDAVAFLWKRLGTTCQNLPEAHAILRAFNALTKIAAPAAVLKSEAIVHPDEVNKYISEFECPLSYNPQLMAVLWDALATRRTDLLRHAMIKRFALPTNCAWVNYVRCHDDIGWAFSDDDARQIQIQPKDHRRFLNDFYTGRFEGTFARGLRFSEDPTTGDARVAGTTASLCGLEGAVESEDSEAIEHAVRRILMLHGILFTIGGVPLLYLGDELGTPNDYEFQNDPEKDGDTRWVHRPRFSWERAEDRHTPGTVENRIYHGLLRLVQIRQQNPAFAGGETDIVDAGNEHVFAYFRQHEGRSVLCVANFSESAQAVAARRLRLLGLRKALTDIVEGRTIVATRELVLDPYQFLVLVGAP